MANQRNQTSPPKLEIGGIGLAIASAALAIFSVFQPAFQSSVIAEINKNTLLQKETGWPVVGCALGIVGSVCLYRLDGRRATIWAMLVVALGAVILGATVYPSDRGPRCARRRL
jgi:hypothetical protein